MKKSILLICISLMLQNVIGSDRVPPSEKDNNNFERWGNAYSSNEFYYPVKGYYINFTPFYSNILSGKYELDMNYVNTAGEKLTTESKLGFSLSAGYFKTLTPEIKFIIGLGIDKYNENISEKYLMNIKDQDGDVLDYQFVPSNSWENNKLYISLPLFIEYGKTNIDKLSSYIKIGLGFSYLVNKNNIDSKNTFSTASRYGEELGYVEFSNLNIDALDVYENKGVEATLLQVSVIGGAGVTYPVSASTILKIGVVANVGLNDVYTEFLSNKLNNVGFSIGCLFYNLFDSNQ